MKSVLITIKPYYVFLIIARKMGWNIPREKTIEVRKDFPKKNAWNRVVHIYCGKDKKSFTRIPKQYQPLMEKLLGKVVGEFICDRIDRIGKRGINNNFDYCYLSLNEWGNDDVEIEITDIQKSCISKSKLNAYGANSSCLYAWHISDLKIYDEPKSLEGFYQKLPQKILDSGNYDCRKEWNVACMDYPEGGDSCEECPFGGRVYLKRPPQSWLYVDGFKIPQRSKYDSKLKEQFADYKKASDKEIKAQVKQAVKEFAEKLKATAFRMFSNSNEEFIYAQNVDVILNKLLKEYEK